MGLREFKILFDNPNAIYEPGQTVSGRVFVSVDSVKRTTGIKFELVGSADVHWTDKVLSASPDEKNDEKEFTAHEEYCNTNSYVMGSDSDYEMELRPGNHEYPFAYALPTNIPSSFESEFGKVRYTVKASIIRLFKWNHETKSAFTVISKLDLNEQPKASDPIHMQMSKTFGCFCCGSPPLSIDAKLPVRGFVPGQTIPVKIHLENSSGVIVKAVKVMLKKVVMYHASSPNPSRKHVSVVISETSNGPFGGSETNSYEQKFTVPSIPPSSLKHCRIMDLEYKIEVEASVQGWHRRNLSDSTVVFIGTSPLYSYQMPMMPNGGPVYPVLNGNGVPGHYPSGPAPTAPSAPPTYEESIFKSNHLRDRNESHHMIGGDVMFAPRYPVFNFPNMN